MRCVCCVRKMSCLCAMIWSREKVSRSEVPVFCTGGQHARGGGRSAVPMEERVQDGSGRRAGSEWPPSLEGCWGSMGAWRHA